MKGYNIKRNSWTCSVLWRVKQSMWVHSHVLFLGDFMCVCWMKKTECFGLDVHERKSSPWDLISMYRNRVHWTRFPCVETESNELDFQAYVDISAPQNQVLWTRIVSGFYSYFLNKPWFLPSNLFKYAAHFYY